MSRNLEQYAALRLLRFQSTNEIGDLTPNQSLTRGRDLVPQQAFHVPLQNQVSPFVVCIDTYSMVEDLKKTLHAEFQEHFKNNFEEQFRNCLKQEVCQHVGDEILNRVEQIYQNDKLIIENKSRRHRHRKVKTQPTDVNENKSRCLNSIDLNQDVDKTKEYSKFNPSSSGNWIVVNARKLSENNNRSGSSIQRSSNIDFRPTIEVDLD